MLDDLELAAEACAELCGLEGRAVRVRKEVQHPKFEWGMVTHESVGVVVKEEETQVWVSFREQSSWHCQKEKPSYFDLRSRDFYLCTYSLEIWMI